MRLYIKGKVHIIYVIKESIGIKFVSIIRRLAMYKIIDIAITFKEYSKNSITKSRLFTYFPSHINNNNRVMIIKEDVPSNILFKLSRINPIRKIKIIDIDFGYKMKQEYIVQSTKTNVK